MALLAQPQFLGNVPSMMVSFKQLIVIAFGVFYLSACGGKEDSSSAQDRDEGSVSSATSLQSQEVKVSDKLSNFENNSSEPIETGLAKRFNGAKNSISENSGNDSQSNEEDSFGSLLGKAESGEAIAQFKVAGIYEAGSDGVPKNLIEAARWYTMAAEQDHAQSQYNLGMMYQSGHGVGEDANQANKWFDRYNQNKTQ